MAIVRILLVEDSGPFRRFVRTALDLQADLQIVGEVADGAEAVQRAHELQPDLILLDIELPTLNGIEAARRMRDFAPQSKIVFVSQESSLDIVREAFRVGARGYVVKLDAGTELLIAVNAVLRGHRFLGSRFSGHEFPEGTDA